MKEKPKRKRKTKKMPRMKISVLFKTSSSNLKGKKSKDKVVKKQHTMDTVVEDSVKFLAIEQDEVERERHHHNQFPKEEEELQKYQNQTSKERAVELERAQDSGSVNKNKQKIPNHEAEISNASSSSLPSYIKNHPEIQ